MKMDKGLIFMGIGFELVTLCAGGIYVGQLIDKKMGWQGTATLGLILAFLVLWFVHLFFLIQKFEKDDDSKPPQP